MAYAQSDIDALDAAIKDVALSGTTSYTVDGRSLTRQDLSKMTALRDWMAARVGEAAGATAGGGTRNMVTFGDVSG